MKIRNSTINDLPEIMHIYAGARSFMKEHGNPNQWGPTKWPPEDLIKNDIALGKSKVCVDDEDHILGTFFYDFGNNIEETYIKIEDGCWTNDQAYGVVHRIASSGEVHGVGSFCIQWAYRQCGHLRIDTHGDNIVMQNLLTKLGFRKCGIIHVIEDSYPRYAYEKYQDMKL